ncbi:MAG: hypothetical protein ACP5I3_12275 [Thermoproteus sp.]
MSNPVRNRYRIHVLTDKCGVAPPLPEKFDRLCLASVWGLAPSADGRVLYYGDFWGSDVLLTAPAKGGPTVAARLYELEPVSPYRCFRVIDGSRLVEDGVDREFEVVLPMFEAYKGGSVIDIRCRSDEIIGLIRRSGLDLGDLERFLDGRILRSKLVLL